MPDFLGHSENPLRQEEWARLNETVIQVARRSLVARRILDLYGPLGAGVQTVAHDEYTGVSPGAVDIVGEQETATVFTDARKFKTIPIIYKDFLLHWRDIEAARSHNMPLDVSAAAGASALCAQQEDELIFYGDPKLGHEGLMNATGRLVVPLGDWAEPGRGYLAVVEATRRLNEQGHYGPYAVVLSPRLYSLLHRIYEKTGVLEIETIRQLAIDGIFQSNRLRGDVGVVISTGRENLDLAIAQDMVTAYLGATKMNHPFRVLESLILRIKHPDAICTIEPSTGAKTARERERSMPKVLVVDDEANLRKVLTAMLRKNGYDVAAAADGEQGLAEFEKHGADVVITDLVMPKVGGMELLRAVNASRPDVPVIMITAHGSVDSAVEAIKLGAFDYITKPFEQAEIQAVVAKAAKTFEGAQRWVRSEGGRGRASIVGASAQMQEIFKVVDKVSDTPSTVLITGESGTGKELVATALHEGSSRREKPFIKINCAAIPKDLMESELFGYERGAFTGAVTSKPGRFELADGGTLFLDEIAEIPVEMQVKLLRALQESEFERVGGIKTTRVDVRLVAATNRNLESEIAAGRFRTDLYYRLNVVPIVLPALRERRDDIPMLSSHFIEKYNRRLNKKIEGLAPDALAVLGGYGWPGNIRELENLMERLVLFADGPVIGAAELPESLRAAGQASATQGVAPAGAAAGVEAGAPPGETSLKDIVRMKSAELEKDLITKALEETGGNVTRAAKLLQISRKSLQTKMKEFGLRDEGGAED